MHSILNMSRGRGADVGRVYSVGQLRIDIIEIRWTGIAEQRQGRGEGEKWQIRQGRVHSRFRFPIFDRYMNPPTCM